MPTGPCTITLGRYIRKVCIATQSIYQYRYTNEKRRYTYIASTSLSLTPLLRRQHLQTQLLPEPRAISPSASRELLYSSPGPVYRPTATRTAKAVDSLQRMRNVPRTEQFLNDNPSIL